jgi:hypothetical protein
VTCPPPRGHAWTRADARYATCNDCSLALRARLTEIAKRYLLLDPRPGGSPGLDGGRREPGFGSRAPISVHVVSMRDPRSSQDAHVWVAGDGRVHQEQTRPPMSVHAALSTLAWSVAEHRRDINGEATGPGDRDDVFTLIRFIDGNVDYITRHAELATEVDATLRALLAALRPVTGEARKRIGKCPVMVTPAPTEEIPNPEQERCNATLFTSPKMNDDVVICQSCDSRWGMREWLPMSDSADPVDQPA